MIQLEKEDMQGLIVRGYKQLTAACFLLLEITKASDAKSFLYDLVNDKLITPGNSQQISPLQTEPDDPDTAMHIAFTSHGLRKLKLPKEILDTFSREFLEGMTDDFRSLLLGDIHGNDPCNWDWGSDKNTVDCMLLCYATNQQKLDQFVSRQVKAFSEKGIRLILKQETYEEDISKNKIFREHFGFRDGISAPIIEGLSRHYNSNKEQVFKPGEFVLGYKNEYGVNPDSPYLCDSEDPKNILPPIINKPFYKDLGKNGTYLVYRQIEQHVFAFWKYLKENSREDGASRIESAIKLGAKMVGRWPGGAPIAVATFDDPCKADVKDFSYDQSDSLGLNCPFGAHIRRTNPRDMLGSGRDAKQSTEMVRKHQILRKGRIYGKPLVKSMRPEEMLELEKDDQEKRGLHFICLVSHISRQFEFIQNVWANNFTFADLCNEVDPLISPRPAKEDPFCNEFTVPDTPLRRNYKEIPQFTKVVGGAYFFLPGLKALEFLATF